MWVQLLQLAHLPSGFPTKIAVPSVPQVHMRDLLEAKCHVEARGELVGDALVLDETVLARRSDGLFIQPPRFQFPALDARDLGTEQRGTVSEILCAALRPEANLFLVSSESPVVLGALVG